MSHPFLSVLALVSPFSCYSPGTDSHDLSLKTLTANLQFLPMYIMLSEHFVSVPFYDLAEKEMSNFLRPFTI